MRTASTADRLQGVIHPPPGARESRTYACAGTRHRTPSPAPPRAAGESREARVVKAIGGNAPEGGDAEEAEAGAEGARSEETRRRAGDGGRAARPVLRSVNTREPSQVIFCNRSARVAARVAQLRWGAPALPDAALVQTPHPQLPR